jgi:glucose-1-phosphate thymidylyltransferase
VIPVVILAAGGGRRLGPLGERWNKVLLPLGDGTLLGHHLRVFAALGVSRFALVVDEQGDSIATAARHILAPVGATVEAVEQHARRGIGHATSLCERFVAGGPFVLVLGDTYYVPSDLGRAMERIARGDLDACLSVRRVDDALRIRRECTLALGPGGRVRRIVEKSDIVLSPLKPCGIYFFGPRLFEALAATRPSALRGEVEITDAIQTLIDRGGRVETHESVLTDINVTEPGDVLEANLDWLARSARDVYVHPSAHVGRGVTLRASVVADQAFVADGARLERVVVFPGGRVPANAEARTALVVPGLGVVDATVRVL